MSMAATGTGESPPCYMRGRHETEFKAREGLRRDTLRRVVARDASLNHPKALPPRQIEWTGKVASPSFACSPTSFLEGLTPTIFASFR